MNKHILFAAFLSLTAFSFSQLDRTVRPTGSAAPIINIKESEVFKLDNGITVILSENHKTPKVSFYFEIGANPILEGPKAGLGNLTGELLMSGTEKRNKDQIDREIDYIGANLSSDANSMSMECLTKHLPKALDIMTDVLYHPTFPESEFERIKKRKESEIISSKSQPNSMSNNAVSRANFPTNHPYGEIETEATLKAITREDVQSYYNYLFTPKGSYIVIIGDVTVEQAKELCSKYFASWTGGEKVEMNHGKGFFHEGNRVIFVNKPNAIQSVINVNFPLDIKSGDTDVLKLNVLNGIFGGGGFAARLAQNLREDKAYTYGCYSRANITDNGSYYTISGNFRNEVSDSAISEILFELNRIIMDSVTDEELATIKASMSGNFARSLETPLTIARFALNTIKYNLPADYYQTYLKKLDAITKADLIAIAKKYLTATAANIVVVGNEEILPKLVRFDSDGVIEKLDALGQVVIERKPADISKDELIEKYITKATNSSSLKEASKKIKKIKSYKRVLELSTPQIPMPLIMTSYFMAPNKEAITLEIQGNTVQKSAYNGKSGYEMNMQTGKKEMTKEELELKKKTSGVFPELLYKKAGVIYAILGIEQIDNKQAYVLEVKEGNKQSLSYFEVGTFKKIKTIESEGESMEEFTYSEFEIFDGVEFPKALSISTSGLTLEGKVKSFEVNTEINSTIFE